MKVFKYMDQYYFACSPPNRCTLKFNMEFCNLSDVCPQCFLTKIFLDAYSVDAQDHGFLKEHIRLFEGVTLFLAKEKRL